MSFVDLMAEDVWSEADIVRRTEAMIRSEFPAEAETILNRKALGVATGVYVLDEADEAELARYHAVTLAAQVAGMAARADMALLTQVLALEAARRRLDQPVPGSVPEGVDDTTPPDPAALEADGAERAAAQAVWDAATPEALSLVEMRASP